MCLHRAFNITKCVLIRQARFARATCDTHDARTLSGTSDRELGDKVILRSIPTCIDARLIINDMTHVWITDG